MKFLILPTVLLFSAASAQASVIIHEYNVSESSTTFIEAQSSGKNFQTPLEGAFAVFSDNDLKKAPKDNYYVGIIDGSSKQYCQAASGEKFTFSYDPSSVTGTSALIHMHKNKQGLYCKKIH